MPFNSSFTVGVDNLSLADLTVESASSQFNVNFPPSLGADGNLSTAWCSTGADTVSNGASPFFELALPGPATVTEIRLLGRRSAGRIGAGIFDLFAANDTLLATTGEVFMSGPNQDVTVAVGGASGVAGVTRVRFTATADDAAGADCIAELQVTGVFDNAAFGQYTDTARPSVTEIAPLNLTLDVPVDSAIVLEFTEPLNPTTVNADTITVRLIDIASNPFVVSDYTLSGTTLTITPESSLPGEQRVQVVWGTQVQDLAGNTLLNGNSLFTTAVTLDNTPPAIVMVTPADGATGVSRTAPMSITFSEALNPASVDSNSFTLFANGNEVFPSISRSADNTVVTLTTSLLANTEYAIVVTGAATDLAGNPVADFQSSFTNRRCV